MRKERKGSHGGRNVGGKRKRRRSSTGREKVWVKHDAWWMGLVFFFCLLVCLFVRCLFLYCTLFFMKEWESALTSRFIVFKISVSFCNLGRGVKRKFILFQLLD